LSALGKVQFRSGAALLCAAGGIAAFVALETPAPAPQKTGEIIPLADH